MTSTCANTYGQNCPGSNSPAPQERHSSWPLWRPPRHHYKAIALYQPPHSTTLPYLSRFSQVLELILNNHIPSPITPLLAASHFTALHKDPSDHTKLWPISMGSALHCVTSKYIMVELYGPTFAKFLLPQGQFGITLKGGLQLMVDTARTQLHRDTLTHPSPPEPFCSLTWPTCSTAYHTKPYEVHYRSTPNSKRLFLSLTSSTPSPQQMLLPRRHREARLLHPAGGSSTGVLTRPSRRACLVLHKLKCDLTPGIAALSSTRLMAGDQGDDGLGSEDSIENKSPWRWAGMVGMGPFLRAERGESCRSRHVYLIQLDVARQDQSLYLRSQNLLMVSNLTHPS
jgi:hypothetical protein